MVANKWEVGSKVSDPHCIMGTLGSKNGSAGGEWGRGFVSEWAGVGLLETRG